MNKDVVYIEPEEDITDIIAKIESSKSKIVALVPPKKAGVFRSIVNIKLITKSAAGAKKTVVLVTTDPSIVKLAAATKIPVTKDLQTAPAVPELEEDTVDDTEVVDVDDNASDVSDDTEVKGKDSDSKSDSEDEEEDDGEDDDRGDDDPEDDDSDDNSSNKKGEKPAKTAKKAVSSDYEDEEPEDSGKKAKGAENAKNDKKAKKGLFAKLAKSDNRVAAWIGSHPKIMVGSGVGLVVLIIFLIWAFAIAPAVTVTLKLETVTGNFSENVTFTTKLTDEKVEDGKFYIEEKKTETKSEVEFEATGKKNVGEKASGTVVVYAYFKKEDSLPIRQGTTFTYNNMNFISTETVSLVWDEDSTKCDNKGNATSLIISGCQISARIKVEATGSGASYNVSAATTGWSTGASGIAGVYSDAAMSGGTDKTITIVQQSDIDKAMTQVSSENESENKKKLLNTLKDDEFAIDSSFKQEVSSPVSTPAVGEEVEEGKKARLSVTTTDKIFVIDETKLKEFIAEKAKLDSGYKIYEMNDPFIENFTEATSGYAGKLKTSYVAGSTITENDVVETVKGKGIGSAKRDLSDHFDGIKTITIDTSVPWVTSVPGNTEKITVKIDVEE